jgi:ribosome-binding protein aMBF1 (putative translation factor)
VPEWLRGPPAKRFTRVRFPSWPPDPKKPVGEKYADRPFGVFECQFRNKPSLIPVRRARLPHPTGDPRRARADPAYIEAAAAAELGQAVHDRRTALRLGKKEPAERTGLSLDEVEDIEGGDAQPTLGLLRRLAVALGARLDASIDGEETRMAVKPHAA